MRILVFFDLPVVTKRERRHYQQFRNFLQTDGYDMLQFSVYGRICNGIHGTGKHIERLKRHMPPKGSVRVMTITEKQYGNMQIMLGTPTATERNIDAQQLSLF